MQLIDIINKVSEESLSKKLSEIYKHKDKNIDTFMNIFAEMKNQNPTYTNDISIILPQTSNQDLCVFACDYDEKSSFGLQFCNYASILGYNIVTSSTMEESEIVAHIIAADNGVGFVCENEEEIPLAIEYYRDEKFIEEISLDSDVCKQLYQDANRVYIGGILSTISSGESYMYKDVNIKCNQLENGKIITFKSIKDNLFHNIFGPALIYYDKDNQIISSRLYLSGELMDSVGYEFARSYYYGFPKEREHYYAILRDVVKGLKEKVQTESMFLLNIPLWSKFEINENDNDDVEEIANISNGTEVQGVFLGRLKNMSRLSDDSNFYILLTPEGYEMWKAVKTTTVLQLVNGKQSIKKKIVMTKNIKVSSITEEECIKLLTLLENINETIDITFFLSAFIDNEGEGENYLRLIRKDD